MSVITNEYLDNTQTSVFGAALPYAVGSLAVGGGGTWLAVANITAVTSAASVPVMPAVLATAGTIAALIGFYCFFATVVTGIYSRNSKEFYQNIGPALKLSAVAVMTEVMATVARMMLEKLIDRMVFGKRA